MKMKIKYRLFLAMLAATGAVVVCMFVIMQWSIGRGFLAYVNTIEKERYARLSEVLEQSYATRGGWDFLRQDRANWYLLLASTLPREGGEQERQERVEQRWRRQPPPIFAQLSSGRIPPRFSHRFEGRVFLLNADRTRIAGAPPSDDAAIRPIRSGRRVVGYLGMRPRVRLTDTHQLLFVRQQKLATALVAAVMLLVSALISLPMANRLVRPIRSLASSMHRLASGEFQTRVEVTPEDELGQLGRDLNALALSLENTEAARRRWMADISHELRTPLSVLRGEIEAIQDGVRQATPESMNSLHLEVMQLSRLVDDLYQISLSDVGALTYRKSVLDLRALLTHAAESFRPDFEEKEIRLQHRISPGDFRVFADPGRLQQLFNNLLDNSLKYTDGGGELAIRLERRGEKAVVELEDSAPGVPPEELEKLFDRLYRVESSRNRALGGAGLGLAICKNIVEAHEGSIRALPSAKGGVTMVVELPLTGNRS